MLLQVRTLYEKAVKDRVDLERRAHSAEAERLLMEQALTNARNQVNSQPHINPAT